MIVDPHYAATGWRTFQNFVGETTVDFRKEVHFICPQPEDVSSLMSGWMALTTRMLDDAVEPVVAAAVAAFAFVFIHPFEDGNGRIHRFIVHHVLSRTGFSPDDLIFPVSAAIVRDKRSYDAVLERFSQPLFAAIDCPAPPGTGRSAGARSTRRSPARGQPGRSVHGPARRRCRRCDEGCASRREA